MARKGHHSPAYGGYREGSGRKPADYLPADEDAVQLVPLRSYRVEGELLLPAEDQVLLTRVARLDVELRALGLTPVYSKVRGDGSRIKQTNHKRVDRLSVIDTIFSFKTEGCSLGELGERLYKRSDRTWGPLEVKDAKAKAATWTSRLREEGTVERFYDPVDGRSRFRLRTP